MKNTLIRSFVLGASIIAALLGPASLVTGSPPHQADAVPLANALPDLTPRDVFTNFYQLTQVPRPSGATDHIRAFLVEFGQGLGLETIVDGAGNVIIRKPAAAGFENRQGVVLQAHMDMVVQKTEDTGFDFATDPIRPYVSSDYVIAGGTTLGADDGIGMALMMAVLQSDTLQSGPIEALFTVDEETTMAGVMGLDGDTLQGRILINLDSETEGVFTIGSAGGAQVTVHAAYEQALAPAGMVPYLLRVQGLQGGHSGVDIHLGRGNATKLLVRLLKQTAGPLGLRLASLSGGTVGNAIPRDASALVFAPEAEAEAFAQAVSEFEATAQAELAAVEPDLTVELAPAPAPAFVMDEGFQSRLIDALYVTPQGVLRLSDAVPGLVETSTNLGVTNAQDGQLEVVCYTRSSVNSALEDVNMMITSVWELAGLQAEIGGAYAGWTPDPASPILALLRSAYVDLYGVEPEVTAVHAGLECGAISGVYPDMDMISIGPTLSGVHSPAERLSIPSVAKVMDLLIEVLQRTPETPA